MTIRVYDNDFHIFVKSYYGSLGKAIMVVDGEYRSIRDSRDNFSASASDRQIRTARSAKYTWTESIRFPYGCTCFSIRG
jgi:NAD kinase